MSGVPPNGGALRHRRTVATRQCSHAEVRASCRTVPTCLPPRLQQRARPGPAERQRPDCPKLLGRIRADSRQCRQPPRRSEAADDIAHIEQDRRDRDGGTPQGGDERRQSTRPRSAPGRPRAHARSLWVLSTKQSQHGEPCSGRLIDGKHPSRGRQAPLPQRAASGTGSRKVARPATVPPAEYPTSERRGWPTTHALSSTEPADRPGGSLCPVAHSRSTTNHSQSLHHEPDRRHEPALNAWAHSASSHLSRGWRERAQHLRRVPLMPTLAFAAIVGAAALVPPVALAQTGRPADPRVRSSKPPRSKRARGEPSPAIILPAPSPTPTAPPGAPATDTATGPAPRATAVSSEARAQAIARAARIVGTTSSALTSVQTAARDGHVVAEAHPTSTATASGAPSATADAPSATPAADSATVAVASPRARPICPSRALRRQRQLQAPLRSSDRRPWLPRSTAPDADTPVVADAAPTPTRRRAVRRAGS